MTVAMCSMRGKSRMTPKFLAPTTESKVIPRPVTPSIERVSRNADWNHETTRDGGVSNERRRSTKEFIVDPASTPGGKAFLAFRQRGY